MTPALEQAMNNKFKFKLITYLAGPPFMRFVFFPLEHDN